MIFPVPQSIQIVKVLVRAMEKVGVKRLIFMGAVGIYNEIPDEILW